MQKIDEVDILVVEDHPMFRSAMIMLLDSLAGDVHVHEADSSETALHMVDVVRNLDLICLDLELPGLDGIGLTEEFRRRQVSAPILVVSANESPAQINQALGAGARGYVSKASAQQELMDAARIVLAGGRYIAPRLRKSLDSFRDGLNPGMAGAVRLTRRQRQVLTMLAEGASNGIIASQLGIAESTVKGHVSTLFDLLGADNRTSLVASARRLRLLP